MKIKGTITHVSLSGGFWGIKADNGQKFRPVKALKTDFCQEGLQVEADVEPAEGFSIFMWGTDVDVKSIQKVNP
jgi:hypothetical protein